MSKVFSTTTRDEWHAEHAWVKESKRMTMLMTSLSAKIRNKPMIELTALSTSGSGHVAPNVNQAAMGGYQMAVIAI